MNPAEQEARGWKRAAIDQAVEVATLRAELHITREVLAAAQDEIAELKRVAKEPKTSAA